MFRMKKKVQGNFKVFVANYLSLLEKVTTQRFTFTKWDCMVTDTVKTENSRKKVHTTLSKKHLSRQKVYTACILHAKFTPIQQKKQTKCCYTKKKEKKTPEKLYQNRRTEYASNDFCTSIFWQTRSLLHQTHLTKVLCMGNSSIRISCNSFSFFNALPPGIILPSSELA